MQQIAALPAEGWTPTPKSWECWNWEPWNGQPQHEDNPEGAVRRWVFGPGGAGQVVCLILDDRREVHLLLVQWLG